MNQLQESVSSIPSTRPSASGNGQTASAAGRRRVDLYAAPHRALRYMLSNLLVAMGRASFDEPQDADAILAELTLTLWACDGHIAHEDQHVRPVLAARAPNATSTLDAEHAEHAQQVSELRAIAAALRDAGTNDARSIVGHTLYLHFSVFVAETLAHMAYEERVVQPLLDRLCTNEDLEAIDRAIVTSIPLQDMLVWLRAMAPASDRATRVDMLAQVRAAAPRDVFLSLVNDVQRLLPASDRADLATGLGL